MRPPWLVVACFVAACSGTDDSESPSDDGAGNASGSGVTGGEAGASGSSNGGASSGGVSASGGVSGSGGDSASGGTAGSSGSAGDGGAPASVCEDVSPGATENPDHVVGDGTPGSCTADALQAAATQGGIIKFDCGDEPSTITVTSTIVFTEESVLDGGGLVTLSGGGSARILYLDSGYDQTTPRLTVQRLGFRDGNSPESGEDTADGGGAIYRDGGSLTVIDCDFEDNHAPATGQDLAGGAIEDPALGALGDNGGPTETLLPSPSSPAIGLGTDCPPTDQRGEARGEPCTAGAVEARP